MQTSADDRSTKTVGCPPLSSAEELGCAEDRSSTKTPENIFNQPAHLTHGRTQLEQVQRPHSPYIGIRSASTDDDASTSAGQQFPSSTNASPLPEGHGSEEVEQFLPETSISQDEADGRQDELPFMFHFPNSDDDSAKVYCCHICNFKTAFKNSLVNHQAVHSDARPWICEICDYAAKRKQDLKKHLQTMHGLIVDSLSLRPGINHAPSVAPPGPSSRLSPVETKPQIVNMVVSPPRNTVAGISGAYGSSSLSQHQQAMAGLIQPLPPSAQLNALSRSSMPVVGNFIADKFPFSQIRSETSRAFSHSLAQGSSHFFPNSRTDAVLTSNSEDVSSKAHSLDNVPDRTITNTQRLPPVSEMLPEEPSVARQDCSAMRMPKVTNTSRSAELIQRETEHRSEVHTSTFIEPDIRHMARRLSMDSRGDRSFDRGQPPVKVARCQSHYADSDLSPRVTSQDDCSVTVESISSSVTHCHGTETKKSFHCLHCDILFFENALYLMHMGLHDNGNPWKCAICSQTFFEKYSFTSHFINQH